MEKRILFVSTFIAVLGLTLALVSNTNHALATPPNNDDEHKVTICHRTDSVTNPYVQETVDSASVDGDTSNDNGQGDHLAEHTGPVATSQAVAQSLKDNKENWGDIIPPFYSDGTADGLPSLNWNTDGQAIYYNNCNYVTVTPTITPTPTTDPCTENPSSCVTPTVTPTPTACNEDQVCLTDTPTPTATPTEVPGPTATPVPCQSQTGCGQSNNNTPSSNSNPQQGVLAASTMASTGTFEENVMNLLAGLGIILMSAGTVYAKAQKALSR